MMKVADLNPPELDYWVAKAEGWEWRKLKGPFTDYGPHDTGHWWKDGKIVRWRKGHEFFAIETPPFSTNWSQGGPIMEREDIETGLGRPDEPMFRIAIVDPSQPLMRWANCHGHLGWANRKAILTAAMRAFVCSKFGEEVELN